MQNVENIMVCTKINNFHKISIFFPRQIDASYTSVFESSPMFPNVMYFFNIK